ncbi:PRTRC system ParB family protein [Marinobacter subterrani]|uniref:PRTRC system ParB family protein n=1 Tax=Marinobacter subterrani TaxID=1658765 RepID=UPI0023523C27|nr:PRTRC system ParB family protein [Marinobacter subterrani]
MNAVVDTAAANQIAQVGEHSTDLPLAKIVKCEGHNPRKTRSAKQTEALRESIRAKGVMQSILVRPHPTEADRYELVTGETRFDLAGEVGLTTIPVTIRQISDAEMTEYAATENVQRFAMSPMDEGDAARKLLAEGHDRDEVCLIMGWTHQKLDGRLQLTYCTDSIRQALADEKISIGHAQLLSGLREQAQPSALKVIVNKGLTVEQFRNVLDDLSFKLASAPFDTADCAACPHNSSTQANLFDANTGNGKCLNKACFTKKSEEHLQAKKEELAESYNTVKLSSEVAQGTTTIVIARGNQGVGQEQLNECAKCEHYGAIIDTALGNRAKVTASTCFNLACHKEKVKAYQNLIATDTTAATSTTAAPASTGQPTGTAKPAAKKAKASKPATPKTIVAQHHQIHRKAAADHLRMNKDARTAQIVMLLALMQEANITPEPKPEGWPTTLSGSNRAAGAKVLDSMSDEELASLQLRVASKALKASTTGFSENGADTFGAMAEWYSSTREADLTKQFTMDAEYLKAFTKPVIQQLLEASGFNKHFDSKADDEKAFATLMKGKKGDILKAVEDSDFDFSGFIPDDLKIR